MPLGMAGKCPRELGQSVYVVPRACSRRLLMFHLTSVQHTYCARGAIEGQGRWLDKNIQRGSEYPWQANITTTLSVDAILAAVIK